MTSVADVLNAGEGRHSAERIIFNRPPSLDRATQALAAWFGRDQNPLTPQRAHEAAAVMVAVEHAWRSDLLTHRSWRRFRHTAAKCAEILPLVLADDAYRGHNNPPQVDVNFRRSAAQQAASTQSGGGK